MAFEVWNQWMMHQNLKSFTSRGGLKIMSWQSNVEASSLIDGMEAIQTEVSLECMGLVMKTACGLWTVLKRRMRFLSSFFRVFITRGAWIWTTSRKLKCICVMGMKEELILLTNGSSSLPENERNSWIWLNEWLLTQTIDKPWQD